MELKDVQEFIEANKDNTDVQGYIGGFITPDRVSGFLGTEEGKKLIQPTIDSNFTKGLETWKTNNLQKLIDEAVTKANPAETPEQKQIRELTERLNQKETEEKKQMLLNKGLLKADEMKLPKDLVSFFLGEDEDTTNKNLETLGNVFNSHIENVLKQKLGEGYKPGGSNNQTKMDLVTSQIRQAMNTNY